MMWALSALILSGITFSSCLKKSDVQPNPVYAYVTIMHLAATAPSTEVYINEHRQTNAMPFGSFFATYGQIEPGILNIKFKKAGSDSLIAAIPATLYDSLSFSTLILYDDPEEPGTARAFKMMDDYTELTSDKASCRFLNMSETAGEVDFYLNGTKVSEGRINADVLESSGYRDFQLYEPATYIVKAKYIGTDSVLAEVAFSAAAANAYTIFLRGVSTSTGSDSLKLEVLRAANY